MEIPLVLRKLSESLLVYRIPLWYRGLMGGILALVVASIAVGGKAPGVVGWIFIALSLLAALYEERWVFDKAAGELRHRYGLLFAARSLKFPLSSISRFRLAAYVRGTLPGSQDERDENAAALARTRGEEPDRSLSPKRRPIYKRPYINLLCETGEETLLINTVPAGRGAKLRDTASAIAAFCEISLEEG